MTDSACPLTAQQRARLHPLLQSDEAWIWLKDASHPTPEYLDRVVAVCDRSLLPDIARLLVKQHTHPTTPPAARGEMTPQ